MAKNYYVGDKFFNTQKELREHIRSILYRYRDFENLNDEDFEFMCEILNRHPDIDRKIKAGIKSIHAETNQDWNNTRSFFINRVDGTKTDFSFEKCIKGVDKDKYLNLFKTAARNAIKDQILDFRNAFFAEYADNNGYIICPIEGIKINNEQAHVDHIPPHTFDSIVNDFTSEEKIDLTKIQYYGFGDCESKKEFKDEELERKFALYHKKRAKLRVLSKKAHLKQKKFLI